MRVLIRYKWKSRRNWTRRTCLAACSSRGDWGRCHDNGTFSSFASHVSVPSTRGHPHRLHADSSNVKHITGHRLLYV